MIAAIQNSSAALPARPSWDYQLEVGGVAIATPCYGGMVTASYCSSLTSTFRLLDKRGISSAWYITTSESLIQRARNRITAQFLANPDNTHIIWIDADIGFDPHDIIRLLAHNVPVIGGIYPKKTIPVEFPFHPVMDANGNARRDGVTGRIEIAHAPTGFLCVKREVFEAMLAHYPESKITGMQGISDEVLPWLADYFWTGIEDGIHWSEDYGFCRRWRAMGGEVWMDPHINLTHSGMHEFKGDVGAVYSMADDQTEVSAAA